MIEFRRSRLWRLRHAQELGLVLIAGCGHRGAPRGFRLQRTPLDVSGPLREYREASGAAWIFTSATMAVDGGFGHIAQRLHKALWHPAG